MASTYAVRMLPQIFRADDPVLEVNLPPETRSELEDLLKALPRDVFLADDSLGWVYQFWQAEQKDAVNKSEKKIGADELPAVTQLFTEDYMVEFLLHNTLGAWWSGKVLAANPELATSAKDEDELRAACAVGNTWTYLRFVREDGEPAARRGVFPALAQDGRGTARPDPCCGSGHFMVFALPILIAMRMEEENLSTQDACDAVLRDNLFGLELDSRCTQIAAFNLALAAWKATVSHAAAHPDRLFGPRSALARKPGSNWRGTHQTGIGTWSIVRDFPISIDLGKFDRSALVKRRRFSKQLSTNSGQYWTRHAPKRTTVTHEAGVTAEGLIEAVRILSESYSLVVTNVPFLTQLKFSNALEEYVSKAARR